MAEETIINSSVGATIHRYRTALGLTQVQLGEHFDVSANTIARWERDEVTPEAPGMVMYALRGLELERGLDRSGEVAQLRRSVRAKQTRAQEALAAR